MRLSERHQHVNENGEGFCAVPMWQGGVPCGFCNAPAYGFQERGQQRYVDWVNGIAYPGYCGGLACYNHGGPKSRVFLDGDMYCAVMPDFIDLQSSPAGFGKTPEEARAALVRDITCWGKNIQSVNFGT